MAWGAAAATLVGQALGARDPARAIHVGHEAMLQCTLVGAAAGILYFVAADGIFDLMTRDPAARAAGAPALRMLAFFQPPLVISIVYVSALRGAGDTRYPLLFTLAGTLFVRLPLGYLFGIVLKGGLLGAWVGMCGDMVLRSLMAAARYTRGRWVTTEV
jgi:Na+-driven multidrug efflux pump